MVQRILAVAAALAILLQLGTPVHADTPAGEIAYLLGAIRHSDCIFIRNGSEFDGAGAADHIQAKYDHFKDELRTAEDFIDRAATKSLLSGQPYRVRCGNAPVIAAADWLRSLLRSYREHEVNSP